MAREPLRYPATLISDSTDYLKIDIVDYKPIGKRTVSRPGSRRNQGKNISKTIILPIPSNISDTNAVDFSVSKLNSIAGAALGGIIHTMEAGAKGGEDVKTEITEALSNVSGAAGGLSGVQGFFNRKLASSLMGTLGANITPDQILARASGEILNPNMELLFNGPTLRSFRFSFKMTPRNRKEAEGVKQIIRCLKQSMAPKVGSGNANINAAGAGNTFLRTPNVFELSYRQGQIEHKFLNRFKQCFLETINVNYTADGTYATYEGGEPVSMIMDLTFKEIEPIYDIDYGTGPIADGNRYSPTPGGVGY